MARQASVVTYNDQRCLRSVDLTEQQVEKILLPIIVESRGRFVGDNDLGRAYQRSRSSDALLLTNTQRGRGLPPDIRRKAQSRQAAACFALRATCGARSGAALRSEVERQQHIVDDGTIGKKVEHLEDDAKMFRPKPTAAATAQFIEPLTENFHTSRLRQREAGQQTEERCLTTTGLAE